MEGRALFGIPSSKNILVIIPCKPNCTDSKEQYISFQSLLISFGIRSELALGLVVKLALGAGAVIGLAIFENSNFFSKYPTHIYGYGYIM